MSEDIFYAPEYSIKLIAIPKVCNTGRGDLAIEFVQLSQISEEDRDKCDQITTIIKDKRVMVEGSNIGKIKPKGVCDAVNEKLGAEVLKIHNHTWFFQIFKVRPNGNADDPYETNTKFCHYDEPHKDYLYNNAWVDFLVSLFAEDKIEDVRSDYLNGKNLEITDYM